MGRGFIKRKNQLKKQYMEPLRKYAEQLEKENHALKNDPNTIIGQFIGQYKELYSQNQRLSVLTATLIKKLGDSVVVTKEEMRQFENKLINIKWEIGDDLTIETATEYTFSYELKDAPAQGIPVQQTEDPGQMPECTDPNCSLPKDLKHRHTADNPVVPVEETEEEAEEESSEVCTDPDCADIALGEHIHVDEDAPAEQAVEVPSLDEECNDPDCPASDNGPHIHAKRTGV
jgi:hypothetical protein